MKAINTFIFLTIFFGRNFAHENHLLFIENKGQWDARIKYKTDIKQGAIFLEKDRLRVHLRESKNFHFKSSLSDKTHRGHVYQIIFEGANLNSVQSGNDQAAEYFNYFLGSDSTKWQGRCRAFEEIIYKEIYPNIDLVINSKDFQPKYTFVLKPFAKLSDIRIKFEGLDSLRLDSKGNLLSYTAMGEILDEAPISYKRREGVKQNIESKFVLNDNILQFYVNDSIVSRNEILEIDPQIIFSSYSGSTVDNFGASATYDNAGNLYGTGLVFGTGYVTTSGAYDVTFNSSAAGVSDIAITKFSPKGNSRVYSTYIGGSSYDVPHSLVVDENNRLILLATTSSSNYPTTSGALQTSFAGGASLTAISSLNGLGVQYPNGADIAVTKFNASGTALIGSTFFGGSGTDGVGVSTSLVKNYGDGIRGEVETDSFGNIYIASLSTSANLPTLQNSRFSSNSGGYDGILVKLNTNLTTLLGFTYYGGSGDDAFYDLCFDQSGNINAAGGTASSNLTLSGGTVTTSYQSNTDGMVASFNTNMSILRNATYYGTQDYDQIYFIENDRSNNIYLYGQTNHSATNYYILNAAFVNAHKGQFISVLNPTLTTKIRSTMFGAGNQNPDISPTAFLVDYCDKIFITGWGSNLGGFNTFSLSTTALPITSGAFQNSTLGNGFYMAIFEGDLSALYYGSYFGGTTSVSEEHVDGGTSRFDKNGIVYHAVCAGCGGNNNFPIYPNASSVVSGTNNSSNCNLGVFKFDFGLPVNADFTYNSVCAPGAIKFTNLSHTVSLATQYFWTFSNGQSSSDTSPSINFTNPGVYTARLVIRDTNSCNITDTLIKTVIVLGTAADTLNDKVICPGSSVRIGFSNINDPNLTHTWTPTSTLDDPTILAPFASPSVTTRYRIILAKTGCVDTFYQRVVVDTPLPIVILGPSPVCLNVPSKYTVTKFNIGNYDWNPKSILTSSNRDTATFTFSTLPITITANYYSQYGCQSIATKIITGGLPKITLLADTIVCPGDIVTVLIANSMSGGSYSFNPASAVVSANGDTVRIKLDTTMLFSATFTLNSVCSAKDSLRFVLLKDKLKWTIDSIICFNTNTIASANTLPSYSINWQPQSNLISTQGISPANFNLNNIDKFVSIKAVHNTKSYCQYSDSIKVRYLERLIKLSADQTKCRNSNVTIYSGKNAQGTYTWGPTSKLISTTDSSAVFNVTNSAYYYLTITDNNGCTAKDSIFITTIDDQVQTEGDSLVCPGDTAKLTTTLFGGATYQWLPGPLVYSGANSSTAYVKSDIPRWFIVHIQDTNGCYIIDSVFVGHIDSNQIVQVDFISNTNCLNTTVNFTNRSKSPSSSRTYLWDFAGQGSSAAANPSFTFSSFGLKQIKLIVTDPTSCNIQDSLTRTVYILNNAKQTLPNLKICANDSITLGLVGMRDSLASITWSPTANMSNSNSFAPRVKGINTTTYTAFVSKNGCNDTLVQTLLIDTPSAIKIIGDTVTCANAELLFLGPKFPTGSYFWTPFANIINVNRDSVKMLITSNNQLVKLIYTSDFGCKSSDSLKVRLVNTSFSLSMDTLGCIGEILDIRYKPNPVGGVFSFNPNGPIQSFNDSSAKFKVDSSINLVVNYKVNNTCVASEVVKFKILQDALNWKYDSFTCRNSTIMASFAPSPRYNVVWSPASLLITSPVSNPAIFGLFVNNSKIVIQSSLSNRPSCQFKDTGDITLLENVFKLSGPQANCKDSFVTINSFNVPGATYNWSPLSALINSNGSKAVFKTNSSRFYYLEMRYNNGCILKDSIFIQIADDNLKIKGDQVVCLNDTVTLTATALPKATYTWSNGAVGNPIIAVIPVSALVSLVVVDSNNCVMRDTIEIKTLDNNTMKFKTKDTINCRFDTLALEVEYLPGVNYVWVPNAPIKSGNGTNKIKAWITKNTKFYVNAILTNRKCSILDSIAIIKDTQFLKITGKNIVCKGDTVLVSANKNNSFTYTWTPVNWITNSLTSVSYKVIDSMIVRCQALSSLAALCKYNDSIKIDYSRDLDNLVLSATPPRIEYGGTSQLNASASNIIDYIWSPKATLSNVFIPSPIASPKKPTMYYVTVTNPLGCRSSDSVIVDVFFEDCKDPEIYIPTGFTPNKDSKNDALYVRGDNIEKMSLQIYDRWGQLIFESDNTKKGWDGTYKGIELEPTVYAYYLWVECIGGATFSKKGNITLIK